MVELIKSLAEKFEDKLVAFRRHLHQNPELSFQEYNTSKFIQKALTELGVPFQVIGSTGVVGQIEGSLQPTSDRVIALRADIDALPIQEIPGRAYGSSNQGVMHACGHDMHTASLLGAAYILTQLKQSFSGTIKLVFQPAEEKIPGGAQLLIKEGVLKDPPVETMVGQHVQPSLEVGKIGFRSGKYMASVDELFLRVRGKGGHGALPHLVVDPIVVASQVVLACQQVVSRMNDPRIPSVLSWGYIKGEGAHNVIPDAVELSGTFRTFDEEWRIQAHQKIKSLVTGICESLGATCDFEIKQGYPFLFNDIELTGKLQNYAKAYFGAENVVDLDIWTASEDFAYYSHEVPSCFYRIGTGNKDKGINSPVHTSNFDIDESSLKLGAGAISYFALMQLLER